MLINARNRYTIYYKVNTASTTAERNANKFIRSNTVCGKRETMLAKVEEIKAQGYEIKSVRNGCGEIVEI